MNIYLIRHTTPDIELIYCYGQSDLDVKDTFPDELKKVREALPEMDSVKVYSSPLKRCSKLAEALQAGKVTYDERLKELNFGDWEMKPWKEIDQESLDYWVENFVERSAPNGESFRDLYNRQLSFLDEIKETKDENIIIVGHGGSLRAMIAHVIDMPLANLFSLNIDFGGVSALTLNDSKMKVAFVNR